MEEAIELAKKIASFSLPAICLSKKAVNLSLENGLTEGLKSELSLFNQSVGLKDKEEGISAFLEKRPAKFIND